jgi:hypothetical protein
MKKSILSRSMVAAFAIILVTTLFLNAETIEGGRVIPEIKALRINPHPPAIDGNLDDPIWQNSKTGVVKEFTQVEPDEGQPATESTLVAVAYDDDALYVAFWCYDSEPDQVGGQLVRRDRWNQSDRVTLRIDPFHDHRTGNAFEINAVGVQRDCRYYNECNADMSWDAVWEGNAKKQPWGWTAEMRIPYHCLRFAEKDEHTWGIDFVRYINRNNEIHVWAFVPEAEGGFVSNFGHLTGLQGIKPAGHIELLPYAVSSTESEPKSLGNPDGRDYMSNVGFDIKYALSSDLILNATINPDFGQVELDQPVLNLSTYETFYDEKRPFFMEGADLFSTDFMLFYSRRVGRSPWMGVNDDEGLYYTDYPNGTTILGAAKLSGKLSEHTSIAFLNAVTQREMAEYAAETNVVIDSNWINDTLYTEIASADTVIRKGMVEPEANYSVLRIKQDIFESSSIGGMLTLVSQDTYHPALTGGLDWRLYINNGAWLFEGQSVFSRVNNEHTGYGVNATLEKITGEHMRGAVSFTIKDPFLRINRLGYTSRVNSRSTWAWFQYRTTDDWWIIRNSYNNFNISTSWNYDGVNYSLNSDFNTYIEFTNYWSLGGGIQMQAEKYSDLETRGNGLWEWPVYPTFSWWFSLNTDARKKVTFCWNPGSGSDRGGSWWANYMGIDYRPASNMEFSLGANYHRTFRGTRWVGNDEDSSLFADLDQDLVSLYASASVLINRNLSVQLSAQGLIAGLDYENYRFYRGGQNYSDPYNYNYDYNYSALNSTLLVRWEYMPGSTLYLVWTRARSEVDDRVNNVELSRDLDRLFSSGAQNIFLIKASYWMNI